MDGDRQGSCVWLTLRKIRLHNFRVVSKQGARLKLRLNDPATRESSRSRASSKHLFNLITHPSMFGNTGIQSSWANPQQNQQQPPQPPQPPQPQQPQQPQTGSVFGQPSAFGPGAG